MQLYSKLKTEHCTESCLSDLANVRHRVAMTRLRMSSHSLRIEEGRYNGTPREDMIRTLCSGGIEDEKHLLLKCPMYEDIRKLHLNTYHTIITSTTLNDQEKTVGILNSADLKPVAKFIYEAFEKRKIMLDSLHTLNDIIDKINKQESISNKIEADVQHTITSMITKIENNHAHNTQNHPQYAVQNIRDDGLKITLKKISSHAVKSITNNGLKLTLIKI